MIQRIQTLWMTFTAGLVGGLLAFPCVQRHIWLMVLFALAALVPFVAIFLYKNRRRQISFLIAGFVLLSGALGFACWFAYWAEVKIWPYAPIPVFAAMVTNWLALRGVLRDEMLVRGADRLR